MLFMGIDWGEHHHDLCLLDQDGTVVAIRRIGDGLVGVGRLHALVAGHTEQPAEVAVAIETDRGLLVGALLAAGYQVYAVNPQVVSHYRAATAPPGPRPTGVMPGTGRPGPHRPPQPPPGRRRHTSSGGRQGAGPGPPKPDLGAAAARECVAQRPAGVYPGALAALGAQLAEPEALAVLELAPTPEQGRRLTRAAVRRALAGAATYRRAW
jgi:hypothetical protein